MLVQEREHERHEDEKDGRAEASPHPLQSPVLLSTSGANLKNAFFYLAATFTLKRPALHAGALRCVSLVQPSGTLRALRSDATACSAASVTPAPPRAAFLRREIEAAEAQHQNAPQSEAKPAAMAAPAQAAAVKAAPVEGAMPFLPYALNPVPWCSQWHRRSCELSWNAAQHW